MYSYSYLEPVCCSMSSSNCCFLTCIQISQEAGQVVWYSHLFQNFPRFIVIHTVKGFGIVNKAEIDVFLELSKHKAFLSLLAILCNSAFRCLYLSFSPLLSTSLLFTAICKASPDSHFAFLHFFSTRMVLIPVACTMSRTSFHGSSGTLSIRSISLPLYNHKGFDLGHTWMV